MDGKKDSRRGPCELVKEREGSPVWEGEGGTVRERGRVPGKWKVEGEKCGPSYQETNRCINIRLIVVKTPLQEASN